MVNLYRLRLCHKSNTNIKKLLPIGGDSSFGVILSNPLEVAYYNGYGEKIYR